ncbi:hypothetical protein [Yinghuangia seranimata]|uniref:hypothetical protein n=1 Tax=Yinghuangia seranimata TaxID=408067 RepID=UPI00248C13A1|nr:hypothetical protein [Yinghuangia seranimata]MDI2129997.1 hypothetical protein [Yinghuangia seranimata]
MGKLSVSQVQQANLTPLDDAAVHWEQAGRRLAELDQWFDNSVVAVVSQHWQGVQSAENAISELKFVNVQLSSAAIEAQALAKTLRQAHTDFQVAKAQLERAVQDVANEGMTLDQAPQISHWLEGVSVSWPPAAQGAPVDVQYEQQRQEIATRLANAVEAALDAATQADERASRALMQNTGGSDEQFNATPDADPYRDVPQALTLLRKSPDLTAAERTELESLLTANKENDLFAERLLTQFGAEKLVDLTRKLKPASISPIDVLPSKNDQALIDLLGQTLASASPELGKNPGWLADLKDAGRQATGGNGLFSGGGTYGYQSLSMLLQTGTYDTKFINAVGADILAFDKDANHGGVLSSPDGRRDPVTGLLTALKNSPEGSAQFFAGDTGKERIDYLVNQRTDGENRAPMMSSLPPGQPHLGALGDALVAATTTGDARTPQMLSTLRNSIDVLGTGLPPNFPDALHDSVAAMLVANPESVHNAMISQTRLTDPISGMPVAAMDYGNLSRVLDGLGADAGGKYIEQMYIAESRYMVNGLDAVVAAHPGDTNAVAREAAAGTLVEESSTVFGAYDAAMTSGIAARQEANDEAANNANPYHQPMKKWGVPVLNFITSSIKPIGPALDVVVAPGLDYVMDAWETDTSDDAKKAIVDRHEQTISSVQEMLGAYRQKAQEECRDSIGTGVDVRATSGIDNGGNHFNRVNGRTP